MHTNDINTLNFLDKIYKFLICKECFDFGFFYDEYGNLLCNCGHDDICKNIIVGNSGKQINESKKKHKLTSNLFNEKSSETTILKKECLSHQIYLYDFNNLHLFMLLKNILKYEPVFDKKYFKLILLKFLISQINTSDINIALSILFQYCDLIDDQNDQFNLHKILKDNHLLKMINHDYNSIFKSKNFRKSFISIEMPNNIETKELVFLCYGKKENILKYKFINIFYVLNLKINSFLSKKIYFEIKSKKKKLCLLAFAECEFDFVKNEDLNDFTFLYILNKYKRITTKVLQDCKKSDDTLFIHLIEKINNNKTNINFLNNDDLRNVVQMNNYILNIIKKYLPQTTSYRPFLSKAFSQLIPTNNDMSFLFPIAYFNCIVDLKICFCYFSYYFFSLENLRELIEIFQNLDCKNPKIRSFIEYFEDFIIYYILYGTNNDLEQTYNDKTCIIDIKQNKRNNLEETYFKYLYGKKIDKMQMNTYHYPLIENVLKRNCNQPDSNNFAYCKNKEFYKNFFLQRRKNIFKLMDTIKKNENRKLNLNGIIKRYQSFFIEFIKINKNNSGTAQVMIDIAYKIINFIKAAPNSNVIYTKMSHVISRSFNHASFLDNEKFINILLLTISEINSINTAIEFIDILKYVPKIEDKIDNLEKIEVNMTHFLKRKQIRKLLLRIYPIKSINAYFFNLLDDMKEECKGEISILKEYYKL